MTETVQVRVELTGKLLKEFLTIKDELGLEHNTEVVRVLIKRYSREPGKVPR